jgi:GDP-4-dehydro-6-deoxy-D-mannose reductase
MMVGDLDVVRDLTDVRDVVRAYWLAAAHGVPGAAYNVCSGHGVSMREALHLVLENSQEVVEVSVDPDRLRLADIPTLYGDHARLTNDTGWNPLIPLEQTVKDLLDWWRQRV